MEEINNTPKRILVIEDSYYMRSLLKKTFKEKNCEVVGEAETGKEGIRLYFDLKPDLVTMDINLPDINGIEAVRQILSKDPYAKIIAITRMSQDETKKEMLQAGALDYLVKPFQPAFLWNRLDKIFATPTLNPHNKPSHFSLIKKEKDNPPVIEADQPIILLKDNHENQNGVTELKPISEQPIIFLGIESEPSPEHPIIFQEYNYETTNKAEKIEIAIIHNGDPYVLEDYESSSDLNSTPRADDALSSDNVFIVNPVLSDGQSSSIEPVLVLELDDSSKSEPLDYNQEFEIPDFNPPLESPEAKDPILVLEEDKYETQLQSDDLEFEIPSINNCELPLEFINIPKLEPKPELESESEPELVLELESEPEPSSFPRRNKISIHPPRYSIPRSNVVRQDETDIEEPILNIPNQTQYNDKSKKPFWLFTKVEKIFKNREEP